MTDRFVAVLRVKRATISLIHAGLILACASLLPLSPAHAGSAPRVIAESARTVPGGRSFEVTVAQTEIATQINPTIGDGLINAIIEAERTKSADEAVVQIRDSLRDFDIDALAMKTTREALSGVDWLNPSEIKFSKDPTVLEKNSTLDNGDTAQVAFFDYTYQMAPSFNAVSVIVTVTFVNKAAPEGKKTDARFKPGNLAYSQAFMSLVWLGQSGTDKQVNAGRWSADNGKLARRALTQAFDNIEKAMPQAFVINESDYKALMKRQRFVVDPADPTLKHLHVDNTGLGAAFMIDSEVPENP